MAAPEPTVKPNINDPKFGFNFYSEKLNGRAAMLGIVIAIAIELVTHEGVVKWLGLI